MKKKEEKKMYAISRYSTVPSNICLSSWQRITLLLSICYTCAPMKPGSFPTHNKDYLTNLYPVTAMSSVSATPEPMLSR
jgi:hypothetical protein